MQAITAKAQATQGIAEHMQNDGFKAAHNIS